MADIGQLRVVTRGNNYDETKDLLFWRYDKGLMTLSKNNNVLVKSQWTVEGYRLKRIGDDNLSYDGDSDKKVVNIDRTRIYNNGLFVEHTTIDPSASFEQFPSEHNVEFVPSNNYKHSLAWKLSGLALPDDLPHGKTTRCEIVTPNNVKINWCNEKDKVNYAFVDKNNGKISVYFLSAVGLQSLDVQVVDPPTWWDDNWTHKLEVTVDSSGTATNYEVGIFLTQSNAADLITVCQNDFDDIRVLNSGENAVMTHSIPAYSLDNNAHLWWEATDLNAGSNTFYVYCGNAAASSTSIDFNSLMNLYDNFDDGQYTSDPTWVVQRGAWAVTSGFLGDNSSGASTIIGDLGGTKYLRGNPIAMEYSHEMGDEYINIFGDCSTTGCEDTMRVQVDSTGITFRDPTAGANKIISKSISSGAFNTITIWKYDDESTFMNFNGVYYDGNMDVLSSQVPVSAHEISSNENTASSPTVGIDNIYYTQGTLFDVNVTAGQVLTDTSPTDMNVVYPSLSNVMLKGGDPIIIDFNVSDSDTNAAGLLIDINYSTSSTQGTGTVIINDGNVATTAGLYCDTNNLITRTVCHYSNWSTSGLDGNFFILASAYDSSSTDFDASDNNFMIDSTAPTTTADVNAGWQKTDANVHLIIDESAKDNFEDGDYTNNPTWTTDSGTWTVQSSIIKNGIYSLMSTNSSTIRTNVNGTFNIYSTWIRTDNITSGGGSRFILANSNSTVIASGDIKSSLFQSISDSGGNPENNTWYRIVIKYINNDSVYDVYFYDESGNLLFYSLNSAVGISDTVSRIRLVGVFGDTGNTYFDDVSHSSSSGLLSTTYRLDSDDTNSVSLGVALTYDTNIFIGIDGNFAIDFNSTDNIGNIESINRKYITIDKTIPVLSDPLPATNLNTSDTTPDLNVAFSETNPSFCLARSIINDVNQVDVNATLSGGRCLYTRSPALNQGDTIKVAFRMTDLAGNVSAELQTATYTIPTSYVFGNVVDNYLLDLNSPVFNPTAIVDSNVTPSKQNDTNGFWQFQNISETDTNVAVILVNERVLDNFEQGWVNYKRTPNTDALLSVSDTNKFKGQYNITFRVDADLDKNTASWVNNQFTWDVNDEFNTGSDILFMIKVTDVSQIEDINIVFGHNTSNHVWLDLNQTRDSNLTSNTWFSYRYDLNQATVNQVGTVNWSDLNYFSITIKEVTGATDFNVSLDDMVITPTTRPIINWQLGTRLCIDYDNTSSGCLDVNTSSPAFVLLHSNSGDTNKIWIWADTNLTNYTPFDIFDFDLNWAFGTIPTAT